MMGGDDDDLEELEVQRMVNPDADGTGVDGVLLTDGSVERAIAVAGGATDFVEGYGGGPQIEGDAPPSKWIDLVTDPGPDDPTAGTFGATDTVTLPQQMISKPVNPLDDVLGGPPPPPGGGGAGGGGTGRASGFSAATAADASTSPSGGVSGGTGVTNIGDGSSGGGIHTLVGDDDAGRSSQNSAMMAGDDDDLEGVEVQRADMAASGWGTQTEDEVYIGATSAPEVDDAVPAPLDPVATAMVMDVAPYEAPPDTFTVVDDAVGLVVADEPDLGG